MSKNIEYILQVVTYLYNIKQVFSIEIDGPGIISTRTDMDITTSSRLKQNLKLTLTALWANSLDDKLMIVFVVFLGKNRI